MSSPLRLDVLVVPCKPIAGLISPMSKGEVFITTKFFPRRTDPAAEARQSLRRLGVDHLQIDPPRANPPERRFSASPCQTRTWPISTHSTRPTAPTATSNISGGEERPAVNYTGPQAR
jgi:hypothetical protein